MKINHRLWLLDAQTAPTWNIFRRSLTLPGPKLKGTTNFKTAHPKKQTNKKKNQRVCTSQDMEDHFIPKE